MKNLSLFLVTFVTMSLVVSAASVLASEGGFCHSIESSSGICQRFEDMKK